MKFRILGIICFLFLGLFTVQAQNSSDRTGLDGDHFSLEGALEMFKKAQSLDDFEKLLNQENSNVNNLDLNKDGNVDYVRVIDRVDWDAHAIVLQVPLNTTESQDIAVIGIEKQGAEKAILQIIGDENLYGEAHILEPTEVVAQQGNGSGPFW